MESSDCIRDQTVRSPVATADDVAGAHRRKRYFGLDQKRTCIDLGGDLTADLATAIGIASAKPVVFPIVCSRVVIDLVRRHHDDRLATLFAHAIEQVDRPHDIGFESLTGIGVAHADQRLCGKVDDNIGLSCCIGAFQRGTITHIGDGIDQSVFQTCQGEIGWRRRRRKGIAM